MNELSVKRFAKEINERSSQYKIGMLQDIRAKIRKLKRRAGPNIFSSTTTFDDWAFHHGGRSELQFNIGSEEFEGKNYLRYGVAFSLEPSRSLPDITVLVPKIRLFNEFIQRDPKSVAGFWMWDYHGKERSEVRYPGAITPVLVKRGVFIFLGGFQPSDSLDFHRVLSELDSLLPLYNFIESGGATLQHHEPRGEFCFKSGHQPKSYSTIATHVERELSVDLRHNALQQQLYDELCKEYGKDNVGTEITNGIGGRIDAVVQTKDGRTFFEIKVGRSLQGCIREAIGQLLEYSYWPDSSEAVSLVIVGESELDDPCAKYLERLRSKLMIPVKYRRIEVPR